jgi:hypothetical protein
LGHSSSLSTAPDLAEKNLRLNIARHQADEAIALEVVDALNALLQARNALDDGELRYRVAITNLQTFTRQLLTHLARLSSALIRAESDGCLLGVCVKGLLVTTSFVLFASTVPAQGALPQQANPGAANSPNNPINSSGNVTNQSNNVLTPLPQLILQNFFLASLSGFPGRRGDEALLRFYWPFKVWGVQNVFRVYQPIETLPLFPRGRNAGFGDNFIYNLALHDLVSPKLGKFTVGAGPLLVIPTASHSNMGDGKWQAGVAGSVVTDRSWGLLGTVITYSHSFSGYGSDRPPTQLVGVEPLAFYNLTKTGWYLRSSGIWNIDYGNHKSVIPVGFGIGKVTKLRSGIVWNLNIEPQRAVHRSGAGQPIWQILMASNFEFPIGQNRSKP